MLKDLVFYDGKIIQAKSLRKKIFDII